jgi:hypothetical protein
MKNMLPEGDSSPRILANMQTAEIYLQADPAEKLEAIEFMLPLSLRRGRFTAPERPIAKLREASL